MPQPSHHSSSYLARSEPDEYRSDKSIKNNANLAEIEINAASEANDWHYGTEELLDALPRPWARSLLYLLLGFCAMAIPWTILSKVDETGSARGRIEPKGATQKIDSPTLGSVRAVKVKEGEKVKAGQILVELESDVLQSNLQQTYAKLQGLQTQQASLEVLKNQLMLSVRTQQQQNQAQELAKLAQVEQARQNLNALKTAYNIQKEEKLAKVNQMQQALDSSKAAYKVAFVRFQGAQEKVPRYKKAYEDGAISQDRFNEVKQSEKESSERLIQAQTEILQAQSGLQEQQSIYEKALHQAKSEIQQASLRLQQEERSYQSLIHTGKLASLKTEEQLKELQAKTDSLQSEIAQTQSQITSLKIQLQERLVRSPIDGVIFELPVAKPGAVLQAGERVAQIAPKNAGLVLKAKMPSTESGFLKAGMSVKIKFDAYPFQEYGIVQGKVTWISPDSKTSETPQGNIETYELEVALDESYLHNGNKHIPITPGQTATAEVIVRQRRVIDFLLDPFKKLQKEGLEL
ncbi:HlyD family type I secretion periplasmic adaptor subunit [Scytonema sp. NUACC21]